MTTTTTGTGTGTGTTDTAGTAPQTLRFEAEVNQVLHLVIHSLYSHKEVFLRELVSNASDALDKLRFRAITEPELLRDDPALEIRILTDAQAGTITIEDTGVGMTRDELVENLGTIAHSGSRAFLEALARQQAAGADKKDINLIGQFGVGFYSAFLVSDRVDVVSRAASASAEESAWRWSSDAKETYTLEPAQRSARGTSITLHLKEDQKSFLNEWQLRELVRRYSDYVSHPIQLRVPPPEGATDAVAKYETLNRGSALWQRPRNEITDQQYDEFYQHLSHDPEPPLARTHFKVEGSQSYVGLIFIPKKAPLDLHLDVKQRGVRLFVRRVFVMENCEELMPPWLRFLRGVVDSDDLPLNVSREVLQDSAPNSSIARAIRKQITKKTLDLLDDLAQNKTEDYVTFWRSFGPVLKAGIHLDFEFKDRIATLCRYESSKTEKAKSEGDPNGALTSLTDYVARMPAGQDSIYYAYGDTRAVLEQSPYLEALQKKGYEVLYMTDPVDEWAVEALGEFDHKPLVSVMRADLNLGGGTEEEKKQREEDAGTAKPLLERIRAVLQESIQEARLSDRLTDSPCCLVVPEGAHHAYFERLLKSAGHNPGKPKRILEINPTHPLIKSLTVMNERDPKSEQVSEWIELLYDQSLLMEGSPIVDPNRFARRMTSLMQQLAKTAEGS